MFIFLRGSLQKLQTDRKKKAGLWKLILGFQLRKISASAFHFSSNAKRVRNKI